ncbi:DUF1249 domain-containing protein [Simiduia aestuariiviva]|uniref:DUF1249 domain-containing protein n=1 Tax=Simiduia aestuariiviva TaxID=1510459 RepID=A0A839UMR2_9GAMM|nr:DUF1249 domain-containing protein [Simiduia aestuariiviva]MBB3166858.1 hypothetical protein [Simiduia aestuariiviva]
MANYPNIRAKRRYQVDLVEQQALGDLNYASLLRLMPDLACREQWCFNVCVPQRDWRITIAVEERARFTTCVLISRHQGDCRWTRSPVMKVRMYHDAQMAEVVAWERHRVNRGQYPYPNTKMYHKDEKVQLNRFLSEWLAHCLAEGKVLDANLKLTG